MAQKERLLHKALKRQNPKLIDCIVALIGSIKETKFKIAIRYSKEYGILASEIMKKLDVPVVTNVNEQQQWQGLDTTLPVNIALSIDNHPNPIEILNNTLWNTDTRFLIVVDSKTNLEDIFEKFWASKVIHVYVLMEDLNSISVYTFQPYKFGKCASAQIKMIDEWRNEQFTGNGLAIINNNIRIENFNGCHVNVSVVNVKPNVMFHDHCNCGSLKHIDGIEGKVLIEIAKGMNMNATYVLPQGGIGWGWIRPSPAGVVGDVYMGKSEFGLGLLAATLERFETLDITEPYGGDECITYGVPRGAAAHRLDWLDLIISEFPYKIWIYILAAFIFAVISCRVLIKKSKEGFGRHLTVPLYLFGIALGVPRKSPNSLILRTMYLTGMGLFYTDNCVSSFHGQQVNSEESRPKYRNI